MASPISALSCEEAIDIQNNDHKGNETGLNQLDRIIAAVSELIFNYIMEEMAVYPKEKEIPFYFRMTKFMHIRSNGKKGTEERTLEKKIQCELEKASAAIRPGDSQAKAKLEDRVANELVPILAKKFTQSINNNENCQLQYKLFWAKAVEVGLEFNGYTCGKSIEPGEFEDKALVFEGWYDRNPVESRHFNLISYGGNYYYSGDDHQVRLTHCCCPLM